MKFSLAAKILLTTTSVLLVFGSCKHNNSSQSYRSYYQTINSQYAKVRATQAELERGDVVNVDSDNREDIAALEKELAEARAEAQVLKDAQLKGYSNTTSIQPKDEDVKEDLTENNYPASNSPNDKSSLYREDHVTHLESYGGDLRRYSVVVASLTSEKGVSRLKRALEAAGEYPFVVQNNSNGFFNIVVGSYDTNAQAFVKYNEVLKKYVHSYTQKQLMARYGVKFSDTWILINKR